MRRWIARQFHRDRRAGTAARLLLLAWFAFWMAVCYAWPTTVRDWTPELDAVQIRLDQANRIEDLDERTRVLKEVDAMNARNTAAMLKSSGELLRMTQLRLQAAKVGGVIFALALIAILFSGFRTTRRQNWLKTGRCGECGYDLRATPERCPECGRAAQV